MDAAEIGILVAAGLWVGVAAVPLIAQAADRAGERRRVMVGLAAACIAATALFFVTEGFWALLAVSMLASAMLAPLVPLGETLAVRGLGAGTLDYGRVRLWGSITFVLAAAAAGHVIAGRSEELVLWLVLAGLVLTLAACLGLRDRRAPPATGPRGPLRHLVRNPLFALFLSCTCFLQGSHGAYYGFATIAWRAAGHGEGVIGLLWAEGVIAEIILFAFSAKIVRRLGPGRLLVLAAIAGIVRWTAIGLSGHLAILVAVQSLHALTFGATHLAAMHFLARAVPEPIAASAQSLYASLALGVSTGLATILAGILYAKFGTGAFLAMAALSLAGGMAAIFLARRWPSVE